MTFRFLIAALTLALAGCAQVVAVKEVTPRRAGFAAKASEPRAALEQDVALAETAWQKLARDPTDTSARGDYDFAVARIFGILREAKLAPWTAPIQLGGRTLAWQPHPKAVWNPALYDLIPADQLGISGTYLSNRAAKAGLGAPLVAKRVADQVHDYAPTPHFYYAATGIARFEGSRCLLAIEDPLRAETVRAGGRTFPLAADYTAPLALMLVEMESEHLGFSGLLHPAKFAATTKIARLEPFDPDKIVVLLVHGLISSPATWLPLINNLRADEDIRRNYQFWFFSYPTGYPYPYSAAVLRRELDEAEKRYPSRRKMVVIGHSMGGCVSRILVTDSQRRIWDQMFDVPLERMDLSPEHKHILAESTIFAHRPEIGRVIFISSPLRGATMASGLIGRIGTLLVHLPAMMQKIGREEARYERAAAGQKHIARFPDSVDTLSPNNDFVRALNTVPMTSGASYHTIVGDRGRCDAPNSSDGVVPYWSSHLPNAKSEKIVPSHHDAHQNPQAFDEVRRILILNAASQR